MSFGRDLQSRASQLGSDTCNCKCERHGNVRVLNLFACHFLFHVRHVGQSVLQWGKDPIVVV